MANELSIVHHRIPNTETLGTFKTNLIYFFFFYHSPLDKVKINPLIKLYKAFHSIISNPTTLLQSYQMINLQINHSFQNIVPSV